MESEKICLNEEKLSNDLKPRGNYEIKEKVFVVMNHGHFKLKSASSGVAITTSLDSKLPRFVERTLGLKLISNFQYLGTHLVITWKPKNAKNSKDLL